MGKRYERTEVRRQQIADAALAILSEGGLRSFTTQAIADRVGIADGTIFRHFKNKQEIVLAAMSRLEELMFAETELKDADPLLRLEAFFRTQARLLGGDTPMCRLMFSEQFLHAAGDLARTKLLGWRQRNLGMVRVCFEELAADDRTPPGLTPEALVPVLQGMLLTFSLNRMLADSTPPDLDEQIDRCWQTLHALLIPRQQTNGEDQP